MPRRKASSAQPLFAEIVPRESEIVRVEKSLNSLGFFTPAQRRNSRSRVIEYPARDVAGRRVQAKAVIIPSPDHGLPTTADRDKYMAFMKLVTERKRKSGLVSNPVRFSGYELLQILGFCDSGTNYEELNDWLERMTATTIKSEYVVFLAKHKEYAKDIFHVFDRVVLHGQMLPDGSRAEQFEVYLSHWQLENLNANYVLPLDIGAYLQLRKDISKSLFGHLHSWFYASRGAIVERRYKELCSLLDIRPWTYVSKIRQVLGPSLDELKQIEYVADWDISRTADETDFKLVLSAGQRLLETIRPRLANGASAINDPIVNTWVAALIDRGVREAAARQLVMNVPDNQPVMDQIEWGDEILRTAPKGKFFNPPGLYVYVVRENILPPADFETSRKRDLRQGNHANRNAEELDRLRVELEYEDYCSREVETYLTGAFKPDVLEKHISARAATLPEEYGAAEFMLPEQRMSLARQLICREIRRELQLPSFEEFARRYKQLGFFDQAMQ